MPPGNPNHCEVCDQPYVKRERRSNGDQITVDCPRCGRFVISGSSTQQLWNGYLTEQQVTVVSHLLARRSTAETIVTTDLLDAWKDQPLPSPAEVLQNLLLFLGDHSEHLGSTCPYGARMLAVTGAATFKALDIVIQQAVSDDLADATLPLRTETPVSLTFSGWQRYDEALKGRSVSKTGFMAMPFAENAPIKGIFTDHFRVAARHAGFELIRSDEEPTPGPVIDRMRLQIRNARFVVADISDGNNGAYWEAGYADGLGKPVIYTCDTHRVEDCHFDVRGMHIVFWDTDNPRQAGRDLYASICAALPAEAILSVADMYAGDE